MSHFNLFSSHKYLEKVSADILFQLARVSFTDKKTLEAIAVDIENFQAMLLGHAAWEEQLVFKRLAKEVTKAEVQHHQQIESTLQSILQALKSVDISQAASLHKIYLNFRKFYADLLLHLYDEETTLMSKLCEKLSEQQLRQIDQEIYSQMSAHDMAAMVSDLFPPCNLEEKQAVLEDLQRASPTEFAKTESELVGYLTQET